jgi:hypothetical protein
VLPLARIAVPTITLITSCQPHQPPLQAHSSDIVRCKGTIAVHGHANLFSFQGVHETVQLKRLDEAVPAADPYSEVIFIGRNLDESAIKQGFATCVWQPPPEGWEEHHASVPDSKTRRVYYQHTATGSKTWTRPRDPDLPPKR